MLKTDQVYKLLGGVVMEFKRYNKYQFHFEGVHNRYVIKAVVGNGSSKGLYTMNILNKVKFHTVGDWYTVVVENTVSSCEDRVVYKYKEGQK